MMIEAIRAYLVELGVPGAETWTHEEIMKHVEETFMLYSKENPETFRAVVDDFWDNIRINMMTVNKVLHEGLHP